MPLTLWSSPSTADCRCPRLAEPRTRLRGAATYVVAKNTLTALAAKDAGVEGLDDLFVGPTAIAFVTGDPVEAAKGLKGFAKENDKARH
ncbi:hypothetical protein GCM10025876_23780 [Demequina litorisediminis]|uniref:Large ribosomal subunit protein uL10 n=1 Tax=Demequina litorisediminis TaxID=1849022 RepID=A0ABQ6IE88_9MICO|nr:hypothetical protein GCM10025876_23780 [Demequina litorisediminis]